MGNKSTPINVLMVCLGNICRSPTAHAVFEKLVADAGLADAINVESAGTGHYHIGEKPDKRSRAAAIKRGFDLSGQRAQQVQKSDFERYDYIMAMDDTNLEVLLALAPQQYHHKISLFMEFADNDSMAVPDPYYSGHDGFELVLDLVEEASAGLLAHIQKQDFS